MCVLPLLQALFKLRIISQFHVMCFMCCLANSLLFGPSFRLMVKVILVKNQKLYSGIISQVGNWDFGHGLLCLLPCLCINFRREKVEEASV